MKKLFAKFRISNALDAPRAPRPNPPTQAGPADEIRRFEATLQSLDQRLKAAPVSQTVPADLRAATLRAVRAAHAPQRSTGGERWRWLPAPALGALLIVGFVWFLNRPGPTNQSSPPTQPLTVASSMALEQGHDLTQVAPAVALAPLSKELELLNQDLQNAVKFLAASVP